MKRQDKVAKLMLDVSVPDTMTTSESRWTRLRKDVIAGLVNAVVSVADGLACAALAGVNPVYGLYTSIAAPIGGSLLVSAQLMQIATTSASALAAAQAIASYPAELRESALFLLVVLVGVTLAIFGLLKLGRLVRFVSHAVMTGFLIGIAVVLVLDQHPLGSSAGGSLSAMRPSSRMSSREQLRRAGKLDFDRTVHLIPADSVFGASTEQAVAHASAWLGSTTRR